MSLYVTSVEVRSGGQRSAEITIQEGWTVARARLDDLPADMREVLRAWVMGLDEQEGEA